MFLMEIGEVAILELSSNTECPHCGNDLGYYGDLMAGFTCDHCGATFEISTETIAYALCKGIDIKKGKSEP